MIQISDDLIFFSGASRLAKNIQSLNGEKPNWYIVMCWYVVSPIFVLVIWSFNWYDIFTTNEIITYGDYKFNNGAMGFGWGIAIVSICAIPAGAVHTIYKLPSNLSLSEVSFFHLISLIFNQ